MGLQLIEILDELTHYITVILAIIFFLCVAADYVDHRDFGTTQKELVMIIGQFLYLVESEEARCKPNPCFDKWEHKLPNRCIMMEDSKKVHCTYESMSECIHKDFMNIANSINSEEDFGQSQCIYIT